ncbi:MAG: CoB--CoM heterodisulfide reductase iron-sulfur subunit A family protein [Candidatus Njordarchaeota archaeon]
MSGEKSSKKDKRIGVYVCHCGGNISDYVDVESIVKSLEKYPGVVIAKDFMFMCSDTGQKMIIDDIKEYDLDGVVVAACSPKLHEVTFRNAVSRGGLNPYLFYHVNIREHCSWAHSHDIKKATNKALSHIISGIEYVKLASELKKVSVKAEKSVMIIGGGITGLKAAAELLELGFNVIIVEKSPFLGGHVIRWKHTAPDGSEGKEIVSKLIEKIKNRAVILTNSEVLKVDGYVGNFDVIVRMKPRYVLSDHPRMHEAIKACPVEVPNEMDFGLTKRKAIYYPLEGSHPKIPAIDDGICTKCGKCVDIVGEAIDLEQKPKEISFRVGAIIVATGFKPYEPKKGEFGYGIYPEIITLPQLERLIALNSGSETLKFNGKKIEKICFIYCVGSRQQQTEEGKANQYCSRYCCTVTNYTTTQLKSDYPNLKIYHLYRDIRTYGYNETFYLESQRSGTIYIKFPDDEPPTVEKENGKIIIKVKDYLSQGKERIIEADLVVLVVGMEPNDAEKMKEILKISTGTDGFLREAHPKLRPVDTLRSGVFIAGTIQAPRLISETLASASAAAAKVAALLIKGRIELEPTVAQVIPQLCDLSKKCMEVCNVGAITIKEYEGIGEKAWVNEALCLGCGACTAVCPNEAIQLKTLSTKQIKNMIIAAARAWR